LACRRSEVARYDPAAKIWKTGRCQRAGAAVLVLCRREGQGLGDGLIANAILRFESRNEKFENFQADKRGAS